MIQYMLSTDKPKNTTGWHKLTFETDSKELYEEIERYIQCCVDAIQWRKRVEKIQKRI